MQNKTPSIQDFYIDAIQYIGKNQRRGYVNYRLLHPQDTILLASTATDNIVGIYQGIIGLHRKNDKIIGQLSLKQINEKIYMINGSLQPVSDLGTHRFQLEDAIQELKIFGSLKDELNKEDTRSKKQELIKNYTPS